MAQTQPAANAQIPTTTRSTREEATIINIPLEERQPQPTSQPPAPQPHSELLHQNSTVKLKRLPTSLTIDTKLPPDSIDTTDPLHGDEPIILTEIPPKRRRRFQSLQRRVIIKPAKRTFKFAGNVVTDFKDFINRGNVVDLAVGIVMGSAFTSIVDSLVKDIIGPVIGLAAGRQLTNQFVLMRGADPEICAENATLCPAAGFKTPAQAQTAGAVTWNYGNFIQYSTTFNKAVTLQLPIKPGAAGVAAAFSKVTAATRLANRSPKKDKLASTPDDGQKPSPTSKDEKGKLKEKASKSGSSSKSKTKDALNRVKDGEKGSPPSKSSPTSASIDSPVSPSGTLSNLALERDAYIWGEGEELKECEWCCRRVAKRARKCCFCGSEVGLAEYGVGTVEVLGDGGRRGGDGAGSLEEGIRRRKSLAG
ncbi:hypothetical protein HDV00_007386 [Rhizophlyctis rosea]|nr:hypothetical protein HDV00_007386 [Rhizophlyctis rosea]